MTKELLAWHQQNPRPLPWDGGPRDPYHIWISEIIMQQTRIEQGASYYLRFTGRFPTVYSLATASADEVMRYWQGLGYYTRARNLHKAAKHIVDKLDGVFPASYEGLLQLPGIGAYTAAAITSFAYGLPYPVVDGNVKRWIARYQGLTDSIDQVATHEKIRNLAKRWMRKAPPGEFNQAIMNFGALVCKPKNPICEACPLSGRCYAYKNDMVEVLPVRTKMKTHTVRHLHFIVLHYRGKILLHRREEKDIWRGLYTPPVIEAKSERKPSLAQVRSFLKKITGDTEMTQIRSSGIQRQQLSHQILLGRFHHIRLMSPPPKLSDPFVWVNKNTIHDFGRPRMVVRMEVMV